MLSLLNRSLNSLLKESALRASSKSMSTTSVLANETANESKKTIDITLTEELPPIPPNYGWTGDENIKSLFEMKEIRESFKYGNPPRMKRHYIRGAPVMRLLPIQSCSNRKFYRLAVTREKSDSKDGFIEDLGSIDPMPNRDNQILVALNIERINYYLSKSVPIKGAVGHILGLAGLLPVHPSTYLKAYRNRKKLSNNENNNKNKQDDSTS